VLKFSRTGSIADPSLVTSMQSWQLLHQVYYKI